MWPLGIARRARIEHSIQVAPTVEPINPVRMFRGFGEKLNSIRVSKRVSYQVLLLRVVGRETARNVADRVLPVEQASLRVVAEAGDPFYQPGVIAIRILILDRRDAEQLPALVTRRVRQGEAKGGVDEVGVRRWQRARQVGHDSLVMAVPDEQHREGPEHVDQESSCPPFREIGTAKFRIRQYHRSRTGEGSVDVYESVEVASPAAKLAPNISRAAGPGRLLQLARTAGRSSW